jgi:adenylyltransferase/sulfurtransferase
VLPGIIGSLQANEALKVIAGYGDPLMGRLLTFDAQTTRFAEVKVRRDPSCPACGIEAEQRLLGGGDSRERSAGTDAA